MTYSYYVGLDLGQSRDYSALAVVEEPLWLDFELRIWTGHREGGWTSPAELNPAQREEVFRVNHRHGRPHDPPLRVKHLERFRLGTSYPTVIERVTELLASGPLRDSRVALLVDATGVGAPVVDAFRQAGLMPISITIHGGDKVGVGRLAYRVPKRDLVSAVQALLQSKRLVVAPELALAPTLRAELSNFRVKIDPRTAHDSYSHWREGDHDDLVLATAMAVWHRQHRNALIDRANSRRERREAAGA